MAFRFACILFFIHVFVFAKSQNTDSLRAILRTDITADQKAEVLLNLFEIIRVDSVDEAGKYALSANELQSEIKSSKLKADVFLAIGETHYNLRNLEDAINYYQQSQEIYLSLNDSSGLAKTHAELGLSHYSKNDYATAVQHYVSAEAISTALDDKESLLDLNSRMAFILIQQEQFDQAMKYLLKNYTAHRQGPLTPGTVKAAFNISNIFQRMEDLEKSLIYADSTEVFSRELGFDFGVAKALGMKTYILMDLKEFEQATATAHEAEKYFQRLNSSLEVFQMRLARARIFQESEDYAKMLPILKAAKPYSESIDDLEFLKEFHDAEYVAFKNTGFYKAALLAFERKTQISDSIFETNNAAKVNELLTKYETEKKDSEIASLSQQAQIQALEISQRNNQLIGAGVVLLVLILGAVVMNQQRKLKHQQAVSDMEQRMLRLQMNPHFIFNALASIQNFILQSNTKESVSYLAKFGKLMRQILEHSREEFIPIGAEVDMLKNYLEIQQLRFNNSFEFAIEMDESIDPEEIQIPPLFAQPFVENAIEHGLKDKQADGLVSIRFKANQGDILLEVEDNGSGIENNSNKKNHKSLAKTITEDRLSIFSKRLSNQFSLQISSLKVGTLAKITLPSQSRA